jgi:hypothetical protein
MVDLVADASAFATLVQRVCSVWRCWISAWTLPKVVSMNALSSSSCRDLVWSHSVKAFFLTRARFAARLLLARRFSRKEFSVEHIVEEAAGCTDRTCEPPCAVVVAEVVIRAAPI